MNATAAPGSPANATRTARDIALAAIAGVLLWINAFERPLVPSANLDPSWQTVLSFAHLADLEFGKQLIFTMGPWGWLGAHFLVPDAVTGKLIWNVLGRGLMVAAIVAFGLQLPGRQRWTLYGAVLLFSAFFPDTLPFLAVTAATLLWLLPHRNPEWPTALAIVGLALLAHFKFTYTLLIFAAIGTAAVSCLWERRPVRAGVIVGGFALAYVGWWLAAGQPLIRLVSYWRHSLEISRGYGPAMGQDEAFGVFLAGVTALAATAAFLAECLRKAETRSRTWPALAYLAAAVVLTWKHGFIRADGHVVGFFAFVLLLAVALPAWFRPARKWHWFEGCVVICLLGTGLAMPAWLKGTVSLAINRLAANTKTIVTMPALPGEYREAFARQGHTLGLPEVREVVGDASIDLMGHEQARLLLGGFNYAPRPVFQSYSAYTPLLLARNLRFFQSSRAPEYAAVKIQTIDNRHPMGDDSLALMELARRYEPVRLFDDLLLMRARATTPAAPDFPRVKQAVVNVALGETITLPAHEGHAQWIQITGYLTAMGKLRSMALRPPALHMVVTDQTGTETRHRVVLPAAAEGFLLNPYIASAGDFAAFLEGRAVREVRSIRFEPARPDQAEFWQGVGVRISSLPEFPVRFADLGDLLVLNGITDRKPTHIEARFPARIIKGPLWSEVEVHAPGEISFEAEGARFVSGNFRIREGAYTGEGKTDGAEFVIEAVRADGTSDVVFYRFLQPLSHPEDRGMQDFLVELP
ncbi:MAG: hypothetical protein D6781_13020, partial [Verrucomicrobia bacterium]